MKIAKAVRAGFTLIELLLSTLIFSILILSIASSFHTGILSYNKIDASFNTYQTARIILNRISLDLENSFSYLKEDSKFTGSKQSMEFFTILDLFDEQGKTYPCICRIVYELDGTVLKRTCYKGIDAVKKDIEDLKDNVLTETDVLINDLNDISFTYACGVEGNPEKTFDWQESWPTTDDAAQNEAQKKKRPLAVKIKLSLTEKVRRQGERTVEFNKLVPLSGVEIDK